MDHKYWCKTKMVIKFCTKKIEIFAILNVEMEEEI